MLREIEEPKVEGRRWDFGRGWGYKEQEREEQVAKASDGQWFLLPRYSLF